MLEDDAFFIVYFSEFVKMNFSASHHQLFSDIRHMKYEICKEQQKSIVANLIIKYDMNTDSTPQNSFLMLLDYSSSFRIFCDWKNVCMYVM